MKSLPVTVRCLMLVLLSLICPAISSAAGYIQPDSSKELFRIEKIPLQLDTMKELSKHLVILAQRQHEGTAVQQRISAQMLALAMRLDPSNQEAHDVDHNLAAGNEIEATYARDDKQAKNRIRYLKRYLAQPDVGNDAKKLSALLEDATRVLNPEAIGNKDIADWKNVVPPLEKFSQRQPPQPVNQGLANNDEKTKPRDEQPEKPVAKPINKFHIADLSVKAPYNIDKAYKYIDHNDGGVEKKRYKPGHAISEVSISLRPWREDDEEHLSIRHISWMRYRQPDNKDRIYRETAAVLYELLVSRYKNIGQHRCRVNISDGLYAQSNNLALTAPLALLLESSATNQPLREDLHICARIDGKGQLQMQDNFWSSLKILRESKKGGRLIVPKAASKLLSQLLVIGEPDFFTRWQVFAVDTLDEAMVVSTKNISDELVEADQLFESIQKLTDKTPIIKLATNKAVRSRLIEIGNKSSAHLSSRMLLLQGSSKRPRYFSEEALAHILLPEINKMHYTLARGNAEYPSSKNMLQTHEEIRPALDSLERMVDRSNDELYKSSLDLANDFRSLSSVIRRMHERDNYRDATRRKIHTDYEKMATKALELLKKCRKTAGLPDIER